MPSKTPSMKTFKKETTLFKVLHVCALYAVVLQTVFPLGQAFAATYTAHPSRVLMPEMVLKNPISATEKIDTEMASIAKVVENAYTANASNQQTIALVGGPGQSESAGFSLNTTDGMVDQFTGDFSYSIPLMDVEGYPLVLSYNSNVSMLDEASWVGLGWNLNVGSVAREMRGIPDDFDGSQNITREYSILEDKTENGFKLGVTGGFMYKGLVAKRRTKIGTDISILFGGYKNTYTGASNTFDFNIGASLAIPTSGDSDADKYLGLSGGLGYSRDSKNGIGRSTSMGFLKSFGNSDGATSFGQYGFSWGSNYHSRAGITERSIGGSYSYTKTAKIMPTGSFSLGSTFTCGSATSVPRYEVNSTTTSSQLVFDATVGFTKVGSKWSFTTGLETQIYNSEQTFHYNDQESKTILNPAFGYFHSQKRKAYTGTKAVMDFNRERDGQLSEEMKNLPFSFPTYDVFYVNGMGISATFRGQRNDIGVYQDPSVHGHTDGNGNNVNVGIQLKFPTPVKISALIGYVHTDQNGDANSGEWYDGTEFFQFGSDDLVQFKGIGEPTPNSNLLLDEVAQTTPAYLKLQGVEGGTIAIEKTDQLIASTGVVTLNSTAIAAANVSEIRANIYKPLPASDATYNVTNHVYQVGTFTPPTVGSFSRVDGTVHLSNHISTMEITPTNGMKYIYGIPTYSLSQQEVMFSSSQTDPDAQGLALYVPNVDNSIDNGNGSMHLYDKTTVPAYASSFLLTGVTSSDYVDLTGNGYTLDDIGDYYKLNYSRLYDQTNAYKWRSPMGENLAFFNEGLLATDRDNTASYSYGEKEIWYTHSVESKNLVAEFTLEDRHDAYGVTSENGFLDDSKPLKRLAKITLYNRSERLSKGVNAKPLQIIEFIYNYALCPNNPSTFGAPTGTGKLTLTEIRVYSGPKSEETALQPYKFIYSDINPAFSYQSSDRWGNYKPDNDVTKPQELYPYAEQNVVYANDNANAWKLVEIQLPMSSEMKITYEADSYRYVQNKRAMKHMDVKGYTTAIELGNLLDQATWNGSSLVGNELHKTLSNSTMSSLTGLSSPDLATLAAYMFSQVVSQNMSPVSNLALFRQQHQLPANVVVFELEKAITASTMAEAATLFREAYLKSDESQPVGKGYIDEVYLRTMVQVKEGSAFELIPTFAKIYHGNLNFEVPAFDAFASTGVMPPNGSGEYKYGYIVLQNVISSEDQKIPIAMSPIQKTALEFSRLHLTDIVYGSCDDCDGDLTIDRKTFWKGDIYKEMAKAGYSKFTNTAMPSQIRLFDHDNKKMGGNARVSRITIRDNWDVISTEEESEYYWIYEYDRTSYGVAAYEPASGNDENAFYSWSRYTNHSVSFPDESKFTVTPIGESLYPSAVVGYKSVTLRLAGNQVALTNQLGYSIASFRTAYEHPTISSSTWLQKEKADKTSKFKIEIDLYGLSQGHSIITNDFHGKPDDYRVYNANDDLQARTTYTYKKMGDPVQMIDRNGVLSNEMIARECDIYADSRFVLSKFVTTSLGLNLSFPLAPPFLPIGISPIINSSYREVGFYTHTFNKHINYSAIVESVETESLGSVNTAKDLVYDQQTGATLLTSLTDEYNESLYAFSYPAHWYYSLFRNPLQQATASILGSVVSGTFTSSFSLTDKLTVGDLVTLSNGGSPVNALVLSVTGNSAKLIKAASPYSALTISGSNNLTVIKSGRKNMLSATMQSVVTKRNPIIGSTFTFPTQDIIDASAITLRPRLNTLCLGSEKISVTVNSKINPFAYGLLNNLVLEHSFIPQLERSSTQTQGIRYNGTYADYYPFYAIGTTGEWVKVSETNYPSPGPDPTNFRNWRPMGEITMLDEYGRPLESEDQIKVRSAVLYGYNRFNKLVPVAQAVNAKQSEIAYDSFDDYTYMNGQSTSTVFAHFDFSAAINANPSNILVSNLQRHSGISSLSVNKGLTASVTRNATLITCRNIDSFSENEFVVESCMCVPPFEPSAGKDYIISLWVKGSAVDAENNYTDCSVNVTYSGSAQNDVLLPTGQMLDGWQRMEKTISIPSTATTITVSLNNTSSINNTKVYFDDIRIHPFLAGMTTTVYDPETLLPMATHDGYNYTTFYGYDENLMPVRVRVETINGIQTISESEGSTLKTPKN